MSYRTLKNPGDDARGNRLKGLKITTGASIAMNQKLNPGAKEEAKKIFQKVREGTAPTNTGTYLVNGSQCYHAKFNGQSNAVAWHAPDNDDYAYIEAVLEKTGHGNNYRQL